MFEWRKMKVRVIETDDGQTYIYRQVVLKTHKQTNERKLKLNKLLYTVPPGIQGKLIQIGKDKFKKLFFMQKGVIVEPSSDLAAPFNVLMKPEDLRDAAEHSSLYELLHPSIGRNEAVLFLILGIVVGAAIGIVVAQNFLHLGAAVA